MDSSKKKSATATPVSREKSGTDTKSASAAKGKGKSKKSKAREEEERRRLEEEERLRLEQEEKERKEKEKRDKEESEKRSKLVNELKKRELPDFYDLINSLREKVKDYYKVQRAQAQWNRYLRCDGSPNPTLPGEINTFLTLWKEDKENNDIENSLKYTDLSLKLIDELRAEIKIISGEENSEKKIEEYNKIITDLQNVLWTKINEASHKLLCNASIHIDPESLNYDYSDGDSQLYYCFWTNLSHNPRIKEFTFTKKNFSFALPRPLTLAHMTIRTLFTNFDILSPSSKTYKCRTKVENYDFDPIPQDKIEEAAPEVQKEVTEDDFLPPELKALMEKSDVDKAEEDGDKKEEEKKPEEVETKEATQENLKKQIDPEELAILQELSDSYVVDLRNFIPIGPIIYFGCYQIPPQPKKVRNWTITQKDHIDVLTHYHYPMEAKLAELSWQDYLKKKQSDGATSHDQPDENNDTIKSKKIDMSATIKSELLDSTISADDPSKSKSNDHLAKLLKNEGPIEVHYKLPKDVYYGEAPQLARWDMKRQHWRTDEILNFTFNEEQGEISFKTYHFAAYSLLQDRHVHMPIQSWRLTPKQDLNNCMITIETVSFEINIEVKLNEVRVHLPPKKVVEEDPKAKSKTPALTTSSMKKEAPKEEVDNVSEKYRRAVEGFANKWFKLETLIQILKSVGLNVFPEPDSEKFVTTTNKDKKLEWAVYQQMSLCSCLVSFAYSRWNMEINDEKKIVILGGVHYNNPQSNLDNYNCIVCTNDVYKISECTENSDDFVETCLAGTDEHPDLFHVASNMCKNNEILVSRMTQIDPLYFETCAKLLESTKLISFS